MLTCIRANRVYKEAMKIFLPVIAIFFAIGCVAPNDSATMESWIGNTEDQLILSWGAPTHTRDNGKGGKVLVWEQRLGEHGSFRHSNQFWVDEDGKIYHWKWFNTVHRVGETRGVE